MQAEIKGKNLIVTIPLNDSPQVSKTGKSKIVASSGGFFPTTAQVDGKPVRVSLNAIIGS